MEVELEVEICVVGLGGVAAPRFGKFNNALRNINPTCVKCMALPTCFFMLNVRQGQMQLDISRTCNVFRHC